MNVWWCTEHRSQGWLSLQPQRGCGVAQFSNHRLPCQMVQMQILPIRVPLDVSTVDLVAELERRDDLAIEELFRMARAHKDWDDSF